MSPIEWYNKSIKGEQKKGGKDGHIEGCHRNRKRPAGDLSLGAHAQGDNQEKEIAGQSGGSSARPFRGIFIVSYLENYEQKKNKHSTRGSSHYYRPGRVV